MLTSTKLTAESALASLSATANASIHLGTYAFRALVEGRGPLDVSVDLLDWWSVITHREEPNWATSFQVVMETPIARLLDFSTDAENSFVPTLLVPPQAGHSSSIVDYSPEQSQVRTILEAGLSQLFCFDWVPADASTKDASIDEYIEVMDQAVDLVGGKVNLVGDCQGGWLVAIYAALHPERVNTLTIAGAPIDFHAGTSGIMDWLGLLADEQRLPFHEAMVKSAGGVQRGELQLLGFKALQPASDLERMAGLLPHIRDALAVRRYKEFADWFEWTQHIPGAFYLWIVGRLFVANELVAGTLRVAGERVDLARITCPLILIAGSTDHITPAGQVWALAEHTSTPSDQVDRRLVDGGHLGLFMGRNSLRTAWLPAMQSVLSVSHASPKDESQPVSTFVDLEKLSVDPD